MKSFDAEARQKFILSYIREHEYADISYLKEMFSVSEMTIRRDLKKLEEEDRLVRVFGGARTIPGGTYEDPVEQRVKFHAEEKDKVAKYAASLVNEGDSIFMDASSTVYAMVDYLDVKLTVVTNNIGICMKLKEKENVDVVLAGGTLRKSAMSLVGAETVHMLGNYYVDKAFLSSKSVNLEHGISDATGDEAEVKKAMIRASREVYFLMDHYKLAQRAFYHVCNLDEITALIVDQTDAMPACKFIEDCRKNQKKIYCV